MQVIVSPLLLLLTLHITHSLSHGPPVPQSVSLLQDVSSQTLSLSWKSSSAQFDIEIFRTELMEIILNETVPAVVDAGSGRCVWSWRSEVPLQCTSHSVHIRAREGETVSEWSPLQSILGSDVPERAESQMFPQDRVLEVGSSVTVCCITAEGQQLASLHYLTRELQVRRLSRRSFSSTITNLPKSNPTGTNLICTSPDHTILAGSVLFVGYPPADEGLQCETRDLQTAECSWKKGRDTGFYKRKLLTNYTLNNRTCNQTRREQKVCSFDRWENNWTLVAENPLGRVQLTDSAIITDRVRLLAPVNVSAESQAWNSTLQWSWTVHTYTSLDMMCEVQLTSRGSSSTRNFTGVGLSAVLLDSLRPDVEYSVRVRCASLHRFWCWGSWSAPYSLHTRMDRPEAPDVWVWMSSETSGRILWKPLSLSESHGALLVYEVYQKDGVNDEGWEILSVSPSQSSVSLNSSRQVAMAARNQAGVSRHSPLVVPGYTADTDPSVSKLVGSGGDLELTWQPGPNITQGYVVEWFPTGSTDHHTVQWVKTSPSNTSTIIQSGSLEAGLCYTLSVFALTEAATVLLERHHVYRLELVPDGSVRSLSAQQSGQDVLLSWEPVDFYNQRGFIQGYTIYLTNASNLQLIANVSDPDLRSFLVQGLSLSSYKFTVKSYTSAGEGGGATVAIKMESDGDMLVVQILLALGIMSCCLMIISFFCYKNRNWVKKAFYPEIPGPKLTGDWSAPPAPLDVKPPPHSLVHIVESPEWESGKRGLVLEEEEEEEENVEVDTDSDSPAQLRYYNQLVSEDPHTGSASCSSSSASSSSSSSVDSAQTQVTYTGIQSPTCTPSYGYKPQMQEAPEGPAVEEDEPQQESPSLGYRPQSTWQPDSPQNLCGSLGSPTSVTSSQFLIPENSEEEEPGASGTWFQNFLSGKF